MGNRFASGRKSIAMCDRCGQRFKLVDLKKEIVKTKQTNLLVCKECWSPDHPQLQIGMYPVDDPQAVRNPRNDTTYYTSNGGSRLIQWGWNPVGGSSNYDVALTPNNLVATTSVGSVTISVN
jgi:hypothetical protein